VRKDYDYITIGGFWNGPDELLAAQEALCCSTISGLATRQEGLSSCSASSVLERGPLELSFSQEFGFHLTQRNHFFCPFFLIASFAQDRSRLRDGDSNTCRSLAAFCADRQSLSVRTHHGLAVAFASLTVAYA
jgi:hypothetical protein